ncbi:MAG TPA: hypothetical protein VD768_01955 [Sphingomicrobium sp.]|nr:hypothetical protein [Sphingomicrobium sp.]
MKSGWSIVIAAAAALQALTASPATAQNAVTPAPATNGTDVGPAQLRDFTLNGTVTRPAETRDPPPAQAPAAPASQAPAAQPSSTTALPPPRAPSASSPTPAPVPAQRTTTVDLPPASTPPMASPEVESAAVSPAEGATGALAPPRSGMPETGSILPWLLAAMLIGAGGAYYFFRVRPRAQLAGSAGTSEFTAEPAAPTRPEPQPGAPPPADPEPAARPVAPTGGGVVSTRLRPWIDIEFVPDRAIVDQGTITIQYSVALYNSGSARARDVRLEAAMFNASPTQDQLIKGFFARASGAGDLVPLIEPLQRVTLSSSVVVPRAELQPLLAQGRPILVPMMALTAVYRWGSNSNGQTSASYLVGKATTGEKLAPIMLDLGSRLFRGLAAREYELRVRT